MFERLKRLYAEGKIDAQGITNAVAKAGLHKSKLKKFSLRRSEWNGRNSY